MELELAIEGGLLTNRTAFIGKDNDLYTVPSKNGSDCHKSGDYRAGRCINDNEKANGNETELQRLMEYAHFNGNFKKSEFESSEKNGPLLKAVYRLSEQLKVS